MESPLTDDVQEVPELALDDDEEDDEEDVLDLGDPLQVTDRHHRKPPKKQEDSSSSDEDEDDDDDDEDDEKKGGKHDKHGGSDKKKGKGKKKSHVQKCVCYLKKHKKHHKRPQHHQGSGRSVWLMIEQSNDSSTLDKHHQRPSWGHQNQQQKPAKPNQEQHGCKDPLCRVVSSIKNVLTAIAASTKKPNTI